MKILYPILTVLALTSCASAPKSAYDSGWNNEISENAYKECAMVWLDKEMFMPQNLDRLVQLNRLSDEEASRVKTADLKAGDPECLAYATYGLNRSKVAFVRNKDKQLTSKSVSYSCKSSRAKCPGTEIKIINGSISDIKDSSN